MIDELLTFFYTKYLKPSVYFMFEHACSVALVMSDSLRPRGL